MKKARGEIWVDGFNLFHRWKETMSLFQRGGDIVHAQQLALRMLARRLGSRRGRCLVFMDGGVRRETGTIDGVRVRYPGPGLKADDLMDEALRGRGEQRGERITAVTSDRVLAADLRRKGARILTAEEFIAQVLMASGGASDPRNRPDDPARTRPLSPDESDYWLHVFSDPPVEES